MNSLLYKIIQFTLVCFLISGCKKNYNISDNQIILFQYDYLNYSLDYQHSGFIIDSRGSVLKYHNPEDWNFHDFDSTLSETQISENLRKCTQTGISVPKEEIQKYSGYIKNISSSKVTALRNVAADAGSKEYICYQFSGSTRTYKCYLIKMEGDFKCENLNFFSKKVVLWMRDINKRISEK